MIFKNNISHFPAFQEIKNGNKNNFTEASVTDLTFIWNKGDRMSITVNEEEYFLGKNNIVILTRHHSIQSLDFESARVIRCNLSFFNHNNNKLENELKIHFFSNEKNIPVLSINEEELKYFESLWEVFCLEMKSDDFLQYILLQSLIKRLLILCTKELSKDTIRIAPKKEADIVRKFKFLVENYFSKHHDVAFYASMLSRSPKTLSNVFSALSDQSPSEIINERIMKESRKEICCTNKSIKEIAYYLGYEDVQTFSRFFKNREGISPLQYRESTNQYQKTFV